MENSARVAPTYPPVKRHPERVTFGTYAYDDPYHWLEEDAPDALAWQHREDKLAQDFLKGSPAYAAFKARVESLGAGHMVQTPKVAGGRWFRQFVPEGEELAVIEVADGPTAAGKRVVDLNAMQSGEPLSIGMFSPSPDGRKLLFGWSAGGREAENFSVIDIESGKVLLEKIPQVRAFFVSWLPDSGGFYYQAYDSSCLTQAQIFRHDLGRAPAIIPEQVELTHPVGWPVVSKDGRHVLIFCDHLNPRPEYVRDLASDGPWRPFLKGVSGCFRGVIVGDRFVAITNNCAARGRLVSIPVETPTDMATWRELVPASDNMLVTILAVGDRLALVDLVDTYSRLRVLTADGAVEREIVLPGRGVVNTFGSNMVIPSMLDAIAPGDKDEVLFVFSSPKQAPALYSANVANGNVEQLSNPAAIIDVRVVDAACTSADGARVPYRIVARPDLDLSVPRPTIIFGYGGFNVGFLPGWPGAMLGAWVEAGGALILAHLRGGGELGPDWWLAGRLKNKQNTFNDLYAIAEDVILHGVTSPDKLGVNGGSNGGVLASAAVVQRPDLFRASVPQVPITDVLGRVRDPVCMASSLDYGDPLDPEMTEVIRAWSPYQNIVDGTAYPAVFVDSGANDPRCPPWHGRKFVARVREATTSPHPVLLRARAGAGHGAAGKAAILEQQAEVLSFFADQLELDVA